MRLPDGTGLDLLRWLEETRPAREGDRHHRLRLGRERGRGAQGRRLRLPDQAGRLQQFRARRGLGARAAAAGAPTDGSGEPAVASAAAAPRRARAAAPRAAPTPRRRSPALARLAGQSPAMQQVRALVEKVARSMAPVLVQRRVGHRQGTGRARDPRRAAARGAQPFIAVNCGAIPEQLLEAEFFGYRKGAFTGAAEDREGFFQAASGGTLFLDEIGDLPLAMQTKLLRAIQERAVRPVGAVTETPVNVRIAQRHAQGPGRRGAGGALPPGPVLPAQRDPDPRAAAARAARRPAGDLRARARAHRARRRRVAAAAR